MTLDPFFQGRTSTLKCQISPHPHSFVSVRYLLNHWMDFDQTFIDTLLGEWKELIRFW